MNPRRILIHRKWGGAGDVLVHRQIIKDVTEQYGCPVDLAVPIQYIPLVEDHPYLGTVLDQSKVTLWDYPLAFDTASVCARTEVAALSRGLEVPQRADIWGAACGVKVTDYSAHFRFTEEELATGRDLLSVFKVVFCPCSAHPKKDLSRYRREMVYNALDRTFGPTIVLHNSDLGLPRFADLTLREWMAVLHQAPCVVSVDSAAVHMAGLSNRPLVSMFWVHPGKSVTKHNNSTVLQYDKEHQVRMRDVLVAVENELRKSR